MAPFPGIISAVQPARVVPWSLDNVVNKHQRSGTWAVQTAPPPASAPCCSNVCERHSHASLWSHRDQPRPYESAPWQRCALSVERSRVYTVEMNTERPLFASAGSEGVSYWPPDNGQRDCGHILPADINSHTSNFLCLQWTRKGLPHRGRKCQHSMHWCVCVCVFEQGLAFHEHT